MAHFVAFTFVLLTIILPSVSADRFNTTAQRWSWATGSASDLQALARKKDLRPVDVEVLSLKPRRYAAVFVDNKPPNNVRWFWYEGVSFRELQKKARADASRVIDLQTVFPQNKIPDAELTAIAVSNRGENGKLWYMFSNVAAAKIAGLVRTRKAKIVDVDTNFPNFSPRRVYSLVLIPNRGVDKAKSFFFRGNSVKFIEKLLKKRKARLVDIEREEEGVYSGVMEKMETPIKWFWFRGLKNKEVDKIARKRKLRVYNLEPYKENGQLLYDALMINNKM